LSQRFDDVESCYETTGWCVSHLTLDVFIMLPVPLCNLGCTSMFFIVMSLSPDR